MEFGPGVSELSSLKARTSALANTQERYDAGYIYPAERHGCCSR